MPGKMIHHIITCSFTALLLLPAHPVTAQTPKGLKPAERNNFNNGTTRALVIGISQYQFIDKLDYAHKDAEVFAEWLINESPWNINKENLTLLTNEEAKRWSVISEIQRIAMLSKAGDNVVFYFSGHGDIETVTKFKNGYLLPFDTYTNNYMAGAISVNELKDVFLSLTLDTVNVIIITDACRSGKLAGGITGAKFTASALESVWNNEIKILSSEPGQLSQESKKWGDGRGVFSYYLVNGLKGAADANNDSLIMISELEQYVGNFVSSSTDNQQQPIFLGPNKYSNVIANLKKNNPRSAGKKAGNSSLLHFNFPADSCDIYQQQLNAAITEKRFERKDPNSATYQYRKLKNCSNDKNQVLNANSQLLSALMNSAQEVVNNTFIGKNFVQEKEYGYAIDLFDQVLENNDLKLPYEAQLTNLKRYLKVFGGTMWGKYRDLSSLELILDSAIKQEPDAAYLLSAKGILELRNFNYTKAIETLEKATAKSPGWLIPKYYLGVAYGEKKDYKKALDFYKEVLQKDSSYKTFDCAKCIQVQMTEYEKRITKLRYDKYPDNIDEITMLDSIRNNLTDNIDSAAYFHEMGKKYDKKNHPKQDSVYYFLSQAVLLDSYEPEYLYSLLSYMRKKLYGETEVREWLTRTQDFEDNDKRWFMEVLMESYLYSKQVENAFKVAVEMHDQGHIGCAQLKKWSKKFDKLSAYKEYMAENCPD